MYQPAAVRPLLVGVGLCLALAVSAGCGGDTNRAETESTPTESASTGAQGAGGQVRLPVAGISDPGRRGYVKRTDRICEKLDRDRNSERARIGEAASTEAAVTAYEDGTTLGESELERIEAVPPPSGDAALLRANVFDPVRQQLALRARIRDALASVDVPRLRELRSRLDDISRALSAFARGYGWRSCGEA